MLDIQLDTSALFMARWRKLLLGTLTPEAPGDRARLRDIVDRGWTGTASPDSAAYLFARRFRHEVSTRVMTFWVALEAHRHIPASTAASNRALFALIGVLRPSRPR